MSGNREWPYGRGGNPVLYTAMTPPEQMTVRRLCRYGADAPLLDQGADRLALFTGWVLLFGMVFGRDALLATRHPDVHHGAPRVRAPDLPAARGRAV